MACINVILPPLFDDPFIGCDGKKLSNELLKSQLAAF